jgi:hypothetical protein
LDKAAVAEHAQMKDADDEVGEDDEDEQSLKYKHLLKNRDKKKPGLKKMKDSKKDLNEAVLKEFTGADSPIKLKGEDVFVNGKLVGSVDTDLSDVNSGIKFSSADGTVNENFDSLKDLYAYLIETYKVSTEIPLDADEE